MCHDSAVAHGRATGAPEQEIEVTPEMIAGGVWAFEQFRDSGLTPEFVVCEVFVAMIRAHKSASFAEPRLTVVRAM